MVSFWICTFFFFFCRNSNYITPRKSSDLHNIYIFISFSNVILSKPFSILCYAHNIYIQVQYFPTYTLYIYIYVIYHISMVCSKPYWPQYIIGYMKFIDTWLRILLLCVFRGVLHVQFLILLYFGGGWISDVLIIPGCQGNAIDSRPHVYIYIYSFVCVCTSYTYNII